MRAIVAMIVVVAWGTWFGGIVAVMVLASSLFARDVELGRTGAPVLFVTFERYQLAVGVVALLAAFFWRVLVRTRASTALFILLAAAGVAAAAEPLLITSAMERLRQQGQTQSAEFARLHGWSMMIYTVEALLLLVAGLLLPAALRRLHPLHDLPAHPPPQHPPAA